MNNFKRIRNIIDNYYYCIYKKKNTTYKDIKKASNDVRNYLIENKLDESTLLRLHMFYRHDLSFLNNNMAGFMVSFLASVLFSMAVSYQNHGLFQIIAMVLILSLMTVLTLCFVCKCVNTYKNIYFNHLVANVIEELLFNYHNKTKCRTAIVKKCRINKKYDSPDNSPRYTAKAAKVSLSKRCSAKPRRLNLKQNSSRYS